VLRLLRTFAIAAIAFAHEPLIVDSVTFSGAGLHVNLETQVGRPYDPAAVERDVRYLWNLGRFDDVRVELDGASVRFLVKPSRRYAIHEIRYSPHSYGFQRTLPEGTVIDDNRAREIAAGMEHELRMQGYREARVSYVFTPASRHEFDLRIRIDAGRAIRIQHLEFEGDLALNPKQLHRALHGLHDYSPEAVNAGVARLQSLYLAKGFFDARISAGDAAIDGKNATVRIHVDAGPRFQVRGLDLTKLCPCLMAQRRDAERRGILDFTPSLRVERRAGGASADLTTHIDLGEPFAIRRIEFFGLHRHSDSTARRSLLIDEGAPVDPYLLRKSLARITQSKLFNPLESRDIVIQRYDALHLADIKIRLTERKFGSWNLSGPVGPASIAGPIRAAITARLPPWGQGVFELSTYTASVGLVAWQQPLIAALAVKKFVPIFALTRGFLPGDSWRSGFAIIPQVGWQGSAIATGAAQLQGRLLPLLKPNGGIVPEMTVAVEGGATGAILCNAPKPKLNLLRTAASIAVRLPGAW